MNITFCSRVSFFIYVLLSIASRSAAFVPKTTGFSRQRVSVCGSTNHRVSSRSNHNRLNPCNPVASLFGMDTATALKVGGPAILERPAVERRERVVEPTKERKDMGRESWEVRIYNDALNTREHVARMLVQVTGLTESTAYQTMMQAHQNGLAVVGRYAYEVAEMYHSALRDGGIVCDIIPVEEDFA